MESLEAKVIVLGDSGKTTGYFLTAIGVGKTSILEAFKQNNPAQPVKPTLGAAFMTKIFNYEGS